MELEQPQTVKMRMIPTDSRNLWVHDVIFLLPPHPYSVQSYNIQYCVPLENVSRNMKRSPGFDEVKLGISDTEKPEQLKRVKK